MANNKVSKITVSDTDFNMILKNSGSRRAAAKVLGVAHSTINLRVAKIARAAGSTASDVVNVAVYEDIPADSKDRPAPADGVRIDDLSRAPSQRLGRKRYVITSAQNATPVNQRFMANLKRYCSYRNAELMVIPYRYKNPTSLLTAGMGDQEWWAPELAGAMVTSRVDLGLNLVVMGDIKTQPTARRPLEGFETITGHKSAIIGHPKLELTTIATPQNKLPKILTTTGSCTEFNYTDTKAGSIGEHHHTFGACVIELEEDGRAFHMRQINACVDGSFQDLDMEFSEDGVIPNGGIEALVLGDLHVDFVDEEVVEVTFDMKDSIVNRLKPGLLVYHDVLDCYSISHHHKKDPIKQFAKHHGKQANIAEELQRCFDFIDSKTRKGSLNIIVPSNHHDHLTWWIAETDPRLDPENAELWAELFTAMTREIKARGEFIDPFEYMSRRMLKSHKGTLFIKRDESFQQHGIEFGMHGDLGPNGSRGSRRALEKIGTKSIVGHSHSPGISGGVYQTGTSSKYGLEYARGPSSWLHTHCIVYKNGKRTLINIINGAYTA